ncbi:transcriptional regulator, TetR family [Clostridium acidisoli DSM 12555]|uniref:Transcriptional regulator, TetR family n=1 Tax=Clostridium acidisoli DSM 12555 TaxID=1121291 RepID=A0A1W1XTI5_9CLOT|nr:TetR/AcrR family transcriptional regulator [Clostridium acidisoli]SMC27162.1 transcriptional regulator, TetR family [Clostridium acidisoli DSM 12555]
MIRQNKRDLILKAAIKIFAEKSYNGATTSEIAKEAGVAEGTVFRYFKTKKDILIGGIIDEFTKFVGEKLISEKLINILEENSNKNEEEVLKILIKDRIELVKKYKDIMKIVVTEALYTPEVAVSIKNNIFPQARLVMRKFLSIYTERGIFREVDIEVAEAAILGMMVSYVVQNYILISGVENEDDKIDKIIDVILNGLRK